MQQFPNRFALSLLLRAVAMGGLGYVLVQLLSTTHWYATSALVAVVLAWLALDVARSIARLDRSIEQVLGVVASDAADSPILYGGTTIDAGMNKAVHALRVQRTAQERELEYVRAMLDTVSAALFVLGGSNRLTLANRAARTMVGMPFERLEHIPAIGLEAAQRILGLPPGARQVVRLANGQHVHVACAQFSIPGGDTRRLLSIQRISGELDAVELKAWNDMARVLAHEMMNSLTPIASLSESLEHLLQNASEASGRSMNEAEAELAAALEVIKRRSVGLLNFVERYRSVVDLPGPSPGEINLSAFISGIERLMSATMKERQITFENCSNVPGLMLRADSELLEQALINLLQNAVEAVSSRPEPRIWISCTSTQERVTIAISDNGKGLAGTQREQIFVPFFTTKRGGSGIGLSIARYVALAHGGQLDVGPNEPCGAVFSLVLPASSHADPTMSRD